MQEQKISDEEKRKKDLVRSERISELLSLGMTYDPYHKDYQLQSPQYDIDVTIQMVENYSDNDWADLIKSNSSKISEIKKEIEAKRIADALEQKEKDIEAALQKERERVAEEKRLEQVKAAQEKQRKEEELAQGKDKERYADIIRQFNDIVIHDMNSPMYKSKVSIINEKLEEIFAL